MRAAIEFASWAGEVKRSEATRDLWGRIYRELSEGKPGMLGAVTGRAEAQVMRLSGIYSLLDQSAIIQPVHHHAAMALWDYCERSAQWIFGTFTGDRNADRIFSALQQAGSIGLTRTEISDQVFKRNLESGKLSAALSLLYDQGHAKCKTEGTAGATSERWFAASRVTN